MSELDVSRPTLAQDPHRNSRSAPPWAALPVLLVGIFLIVLDFFIVNVALPSMQVELGAGPSVVEWVVAGYGLTFAVLLLVSGRIGDVWGRRRLFMLGLALFTLTSAACGLAPTAGLLVAARLAQGASAALIGPSVLGSISALFSGPHRARAIGLYATVMGVAAAGGQVIGGLLLAAVPAGLGWRSVFLINLPIGLAGLLLAPRLVPESRATHGGGIDLPGLVLATAGLTALVLPLLEGHRLGWPVWTWVSLAGAPVLLAGFAGRQRRQAAAGRTPLLDLGLFSSRGFSAGMLAQLTLWCGQASYFLFLGLYLQQGRGLSALRAGLVFTVLAAAYLVSSSRAAALIARQGRAVVTEGALLLAGGHLAMLLAVARIGDGGPVVALMPGLVLVGTGMGLCITALTSIVLADAGPSRAGSVSGALSTVQQVGNAIGVAVIGLIFFGSTGAGEGGAFAACLGALAALQLGLACLSRLLPGRPAAAQPHQTDAAIAA